jgi:hypothetical protein
MMFILIVQVQISAEAPSTRSLLVDFHDFFTRMLETNLKYHTIYPSTVLSTSSCLFSDRKAVVRQPTIQTSCRAPNNPYIAVTISSMNVLRNIQVDNFTVRQPVNKPWRPVGV